MQDHDLVLTSSLWMATSAQHPPHTHTHTHTHTHNTELFHSTEFFIDYIFGQAAIHTGLILVNMVYEFTASVLDGHGEPIKTLPRCKNND